MMPTEERRRILKMVEDGRIGAEEALLLLHALEQDSAGAEKEAGEAAPAAGAAASAGDASPRLDPALEEVARRARRWAWIPLGFGVGLTVLSAGLMYGVLRSTGFGFWFYCLSLPLALGVLLMTLSAGSVSMRWLFVDIRQKPGKRPERITLGFPLPLRLLRWVLDTFGHHVPGLQARQQVWDTLEFLERGLSADTPLMVHVDDEDGEQVRVYLG